MPYFHHFITESMVNNKCCSPQGNNNSVIKQVKSGYLLHFKKRLFGKAWREEFVVLYEDSSLIWFRDRDRLDPEGGIFLKDAPEMLAAGQWTNRVPSHPEFPAGSSLHQSIAVGTRLRKDKVHWFLCKSNSELVDWMSAISHTLPPPPPPPDEPRDSRRNQTKATLGTPPSARQPLPVAADPRFAMLKHQPSSPDVLLGKMGRISLNDQTGGQPLMNSQLTETSRSYSAGKVSSLDASGKPRVTFRDDVMAGVMMAGALTQWNSMGAAGGFLGGAGASGSTPWDWGMGWGWAGWTPEGATVGMTAAAYCGSCALEQQQAAMTAAAASSSSNHHSSSSLSDKNDFYFDDDHEIGEMGETADVGCDFGDFGF